MASILQSFEEYQKSRVKFVQAVADAATRPQNIEIMNNAGVMQLLRPLLLDTVPSVQQTAALALGRLANYNETLAQSVVSNDVLPHLVFSLSDQNKFYKKSAAFVLRAVAKHTPELAQAVIDSNALPGLVACLEEFDPSVKEAAAWALGYIAQHTAELATKVVESGAIPLLATCTQDPDLTLRRIAVSSLGDISKHSADLAQAVVNSNVVEILVSMVLHLDSKLRRQISGTLSQICKHTVDLAEVIVEAEIFPNILHCLKDADVLVKKNACICVREISKHSVELSKLIINAGGGTALVDYVAESQGSNKLPGIMTLGYIAAFSETLALAIIVAKGIEPVKDALVHETEDHIKAAAAWTLGQLGKHSADHARAIAEHDVLRHLLACMVHKDSSDDLQTKSKRALKSILTKCNHLQALQPLLRDSPVKVQKYVLKQFALLLPHDVEARRNFVQSGGLQFLQELNETVGDALSEYIVQINQCYPQEVVEYYSPNYSKTLLDKINDFQPATIAV